ncbi:MAG: sulfatase-like hydrolase/transferase [Verrucomicrobia bacterium]|nr:sulfatase-like hydrolase/transferase [Verrucomicrobiota bacterium]MCH8513121.1 sulfatase-like hydrolase/transferase [Kiritimatiellia bacterium]
MPPNILILMSDEHRADVAGFAGDPVVRTPTLDWLAQDGVAFENAYTPSPICVPSRQCTLAGQYPHTCGCEGWTGLKPGHMTYASRLGQFGYRTAAFGKLHMIGPDQSGGFQSRPVGDVNFGQTQPVIEPWRDTLAEDPRHVPGMNKWSDRKEIERADPGPDNPHDVHSVEGAIDWIRETFVGDRYDRQNADRPQLIHVGLHDPHYPYQCDPELFRYYLPRMKRYEIEVPFDHPFLGLSPWPPEPLHAGVHIAERDVMRARAAYYGKVETMDRNFGGILQTLRDAGQDLDEWIIVYLSDHGDQLGEHGVWEKQKFFEGSVRVPLIIRAPQHLPVGKTVPQNVNLVDLFATLCDLAKVQTPEGLDSRSLVPLARGEATNWPDDSHSYFLQQGFRNGMIKQGSLKYHWYHHETRGEMPEVLFDLETDPLETQNLIDDPRYTEKVEAFRKQRTM